LPSLREYLLIAQDRMAVEVHDVKRPDQVVSLDRPEDVLRLKSVDFAMTLAELYE